MNKQKDRFDASWKPFRDQILDRMANELGINAIRLEVRSGLENPVAYWKKLESGEIGYQGFRHNRYEKINNNDDPNIANPAGLNFSHLDWQVEEVLLPLQRFLEGIEETIHVSVCYVDFDGSLEGNLQHALNSDEYAELMHEAFLHLKAKYNIVPDSLEAFSNRTTLNSGGKLKLAQRSSAPSTTALERIFRRNLWLPRPRKHATLRVTSTRSQLCKAH